MGSQELPKLWITVANIAEVQVKVSGMIIIFLSPRGDQSHILYLTSEA